VAKSDLRKVSLCAKRIEEARFNLIDAIIRARDSGESLRDIADAAGLSHQRIHQLVTVRRRPSPPAGQEESEQ
jgi:hypothetical protein